LTRTHHEHTMAEFSSKAKPIDLAHAANRHPSA
jgi:hypothetical protein